MIRSHRRLPVGIGRLALGGNPLPRSLDDDFEAIRLDRLQQIVDRVDLERLDRMLIECRDEDDVRRQLMLDHLSRHLEPGQPRHLYIKKYDVGRQSFYRSERLQPVASLADYVNSVHLAEQIAQLIARELLIVDKNSA